MTERLMRIGEVADRIGITTRTLRYYEELGLVSPSGHTAGGSRRYAEADYQRVLRIRELQAVMGFNLDEIRELLAADDRLDALRTEYRAGASDTRQAEIVHEVMRLNARTQEQVLAKIAVLQSYQDELQRKERVYRAIATEHDIDVTATTP